MFLRTHEVLGSIRSTSKIMTRRCRPIRWFQQVKVYPPEPTWSWNGGLTHKTALRASHVCPHSTQTHAHSSWTRRHSNNMHTTIFNFLVQVPFFCRLGQSKQTHVHQGMYRQRDAAAISDSRTPAA